MADVAYSLDRFKIKYNLDDIGEGEVYFHWMFRGGEAISMCETNGLSKQQLIRVMTAFVDGQDEFHK